MADTIAGNTTTTSTLYANTWASSVIDYWGDSDWWRTYFTSGYGYIIEMGGWDSLDGTLYDPWLGLTNSFGTLLAYDDDSGYGLNSWLYWSATSTGTYYVRAEESGNSGTGSYVVSITSDFLANTFTAAYLPIGSSVQEEIDFAGDSDWVRVSLTAGQTYVFDLVGSGADTLGATLDDPYLVLRNSAGSFLLSADDGGIGLSSRIVYTPSVSGDYFLDAQEFGYDATGSYVLRANVAPVSGVLP